MQIIQAETMLDEAISAFDFKGEILQKCRYGEGHINDTFLIEERVNNAEIIHKYILQRINTNIFKNPDMLMKNIVGVTQYQKKIIQKNNGDIKREAMTVMLTKNGKDYFIDSKSGAWRLYEFVVDTYCLQKAIDANDFYQSAKAFGNFQKQLLDYPADTLFEIIPKFHDTYNRFLNLKKSVETDKLNRAKNVENEIKFAFKRENDCKILMNMLKNNQLPLRVTHNDTKLNNILMDNNTKKGVCIIDLDTVMPGLIANDFGDSIRFGANHSSEDEKDLSKVNFDLALYAIYVKGFLEGIDNQLTESELQSLPIGAKLMTLECGMRFLTDYIDGDTYFKTSYDGQNLDRCRTQFKLVSDMEIKMDTMIKITNDRGETNEL